MIENFGLRELYEVSLKATYPIEVKGRKIEVGETIAVFDRIQLADFVENKNFIRGCDSLWGKFSGQFGYVA